MDQKITMEIRKYCEINENITYQKLHDTDKMKQMCSFKCMIGRK